MISFQGISIISGETAANPARIAAFDLDWTLTRNIHGKFFRDSYDWALLPNRTATLTDYKNKGYTIVIFTNQAYKGTKLNNSLERINNINAELLRIDIKPWWFISTTQDNYHKPNTGMWQGLLHYIPTIDMTVSFFTGDAAGRPQDHARSDIDFAAGVGLKFYIPEQIFPSVQIKIPTDGINLYIFVGMPGVGKTTFYQNNLAPLGYVHANQDTLKTKDKVLKYVNESLRSGRSVAVDATNPTLLGRREFIAMAATHRVPTMILYFVGNGSGWNKLREKPVPEIAYSIYYKNLVEPTESGDGVPVEQIIY